MDTLVLNKDGNPLSILPLSVIGWQDAVRLMWLDKIVVIKEYDNWVVHSTRTSMHVPSIVMSTEYIKNSTKVKYSRTNIFLRDDYVCQLCNKKFNHDELTLDHILPRSKGGKTTWTNIVTACKRCNSDKGDDHTVVPRKMPHRPTYFEMLSKRKKFPIRVREMEWATYLGWTDTNLIKLDLRRGT